MTPSFLLVSPKLLAPNLLTAPLEMAWTSAAVLTNSFSDGGVVRTENFHATSL